MAQIIRAEINADVLCWARQSAGYDLEKAAKKIGVAIERLQAFEAGTLYPTLNQLRKIGTVYKRPSAIFYCSSPPSSPKDIHDFRTLPDIEVSSSPELLFEIRRAFERRAIALDLTTQLGEEPITRLTDGDINEPPAVLATRIREMLAVPLEEQYSWRDEYTALRNWISAVEALGVLVFQVGGIEVEQFRGFSIGERPFPAIGLNAKDSPRGRIFTIMHELTHIILHQEGLCNLVEGSNQEVFCNMVAGAVLVPEKEFLREDIVQQNRTKQWEDDQLRSLANKYMVSSEVILRRLLLLGRTTNRLYSEKREQLQDAYRNQPKSAGFIKYPKKIFRNNGFLFTNLVLTAYYQDSITTRDLMNYLGGIKFSHIDNIEQELSHHLDRGVPSHVLD